MAQATNTKPPVAVTTKVVEQVQCQQCDAVWTPKVLTDELPKQCPYCHSRYWRRKRVRGMGGDGK